MQVNLCSISTNEFRSVIVNLDAIAPDEIYDLSGQSSVSLSFEQPLDTFQNTTFGTLNLLECLRMRNSDARLFFCGV